MLRDIAKVAELLRLHSLYRSVSFLVELINFASDLFRYSTFKVSDDESQENDSSEDTESRLPLQLAIVGRPNVGKSTLLNTLLQEDRVLVGPEAGLTRDSIRAEFQYEGRTIYLVSICDCDINILLLMYEPVMGTIQIG